jgi:hypothetical protein
VITPDEIRFMVATAAEALDVATRPTARSGGHDNLAIP